jgi:hypothetical protein
VNVGEALSGWRSRHNRADTGGQRIFWVALGPLSVPVPHPRALHWHDLHHVALGVGPDLVGEIEVSAFELRTGAANVIVFFLCISAVFLGMFVAPRSTLRAFRRARGRRNLYRCSVAYEEVLAWSVSELRVWMRIDTTHTSPPAPFAAKRSP